MLLPKIMKDMYDGLWRSWCARPPEERKDTVRSRGVRPSVVTQAATGTDCKSVASASEVRVLHYAPWRCPGHTAISGGAQMEFDSLHLHLTGFSSEARTLVLHTKCRGFESLNPDHINNIIFMSDQEEGLTEEDYDAFDADMKAALEGDDGSDEKTFYRYEVLKGFVDVPVRRGMTEIKVLFDFLKKFDGRAFICGGYVRYMCSPDKHPFEAGDVDVYCSDNETYEEVLRELKEHVAIKHENENAITFYSPADGKYKYCPIIQLIKPFNKGAIVATGDMETILKNFDFTVVRCGLKDEETCLVDANFEHDENKKFLRILNIHCPISSMIRFMKYSRKGYYTTPIEALKLFNDWDNRDDDYRREIIEGVQRIEDGEELSDEQINELEALMSID